jgi:DNA-binding IclR family transcriptional regulator
MTTPPGGTQSIVRTLHILKLFDDANPRWSLHDLTQASGLNKTTLFRMLGALESEGLLEKDANGDYMLGSELIALGGRAARANNLRSCSHDPLRMLTQQTGETTTLEILRPDRDGTWSTLVIDEVLGRFLVGITQYIGSRLPIHATSTGKIMLAYLDADERDTLLNGHFEQITDATLSDHDALLGELAQIHQQGYATAIGEMERGLVAIGAPIFDVNGRVQAAISLTGPSVRLRDAQINAYIPLVCQTAATISHQIGYRPDTVSTPPTR